MRAAIGLFEQKRDLIALGAHVKGADPRLDAVIAAMPRIERFVLQSAGEISSYERTKAALLDLGGAGG